jgi:hypothetical protein
MTDYKTLLKQNLEAILRDMRTASPEDKRHLAMAAKSLADIEQGGSLAGGDLLSQLRALVATQPAPTSDELDTLTHLKEDSEEES